MYKGIYAEKKTFSKFDNEHYLCYLNEQREEYSPEPDARSGEVTEPLPYWDMPIQEVWRTEVL